MKRTRLSLFYLAGYLWGGGLALMADPQLAAELLQSNAHYSDIMLRALGMFMIVLGIIIIQIIRLRIEQLYPATLVARVFICISLIVFFFMSSDPFFLVLLGIVGLGLLITGSSYFSEKDKQITA